MFSFLSEPELARSYPLSQSILQVVLINNAFLTVLTDLIRLLKGWNLQS